MQSKKRSHLRASRTGLGVTVAAALALCLVGCGGDDAAPPGPPPGGSLSFSASTYAVTEDGGTVTLTVARTGASAGAVTVQVDTSNGSATAGADYTAVTAQTLSWADGDTSNKTLNVTILNDSDVEISEQYTAALSNATGGATVGTISNATVTINDEQPIWVYAVYLAADNDLAVFGLTDMFEMESVASTEEVRVVVQAEFSTSHLANMSVTPAMVGLTTFGTSRFVVRKDASANETIDSPQVVIGDQDMGSGATLQAFIEWVAQEHPATHTALVLWNHGSGWSGVCQDETSDSYMSLAQLRQALVDTSSQFAVINFDACLMAMYEAAYMVDGYCDYLVAAEETEPGQGDPYDLILGDLVATPAMTPATLASTTAVRFVESYKTGGVSEQSVTKSALDMAQFAEFNTAVSNLAVALQADLAAERTEIEAARDGSQDYSSPGHHDMGDFCLGLALLCSDTDVLTYAIEVGDIITRATDPLVIENQFSTGTRSGGSAAPRDVDSSMGIAAFIPKEADLPDEGSASLAGYDAFTGAANPDWVDFVDALVASYTPYDAVVGDFGFYLVWGDASVDVDLYVEEPTDEWASPWIGSVSTNGILSGDSAVSGEPYEVYVAKDYVMQGNYTVFCNLYDLASAGSVTVSFYYYDGVGGTGNWEFVENYVLDDSNPAPANWWTVPAEVLNVAAGVYSDWYIFGAMTK